MSYSTHATDSSRNGRLKVVLWAISIQHPEVGPSLRQQTGIKHIGRVIYKITFNGWTTVEKIMPRDLANEAQGLLAAKQ